MKDKTIEAVKYMIAVWDEVMGTWREKPDHVQQKFLEAESELASLEAREEKHTTCDGWKKNIQLAMDVKCFQIVDVCWMIHARNVLIIICGLQKKRSQIKNLT